MPNLWRMSLIVSALAIPLYLFIDHMENHKKAILRLRPDGVEFPRDGLPPLHWNDISSIDMAVVNMIGRGGPQDYLGITLHPYCRPKNASPFMSIFGKLAMTLTQWSFDVIYPMHDLDHPVPHIVMEMRARAEAAAVQPPQAPMGEQPIQPGACATAQATAGARASIGTMIFSGLMGLFGFIVCAKQIERIVTKAQVKATQLSPEAAFLVGCAFVAVCYFTWPSGDDD